MIKQEDCEVSPELRFQKECEVEIEKISTTFRNLSSDENVTNAKKKAEYLAPKSSKEFTNFCKDEIESIWHRTSEEEQ